MNYLSNYSNLTLNRWLTNASLATNTSISNNHILLDASEILYKTIVYSLTIPVFILTTAGNGVILVTIKYQARLLSSNSNFFILSLALADFFVGIAVMPFMISFTANHQSWIHTQGLCDFYMIFDFVCSSASFLTLSAMSIERYKMLTTSYVQIKHSSKIRIIIFVLLSWLLPAFTWTPLIIGFRYFKNNDLAMGCSLPADKYLVLIICIALYHVPLICMVTFYTMLIIHIRKSSGSMHHLDSLKNDYSYPNFNRMNYQSNNLIKNSQQRLSNHCYSNHQDLNNNNKNNNSKHHHDSLNLDETVRFKRNTENNNQNEKIRCRLFASQILLKKDNQKFVLKQVPMNASCKQSRPCRSISFTNYNFTPLNKNKKFRSNFTIRYVPDKSTETTRFNRYAAGSQLSKVNSDNFFARISNGSSNGNEAVNAVRFQVSTNSNGNKEIKEINSTVQDETYCHKITNNSSRNFFSRLRYSFQSNAKIETHRSSSQVNENNDYRYMRLKRNRKAARMLGLLVAAFLICWLPYIVFFPISHFYPQLIPNYLNLFIWWLGYLNSTINPFLYVYSNKNIRRSVRNLFCRLIYSLRFHCICKIFLVNNSKLMNNRDSLKQSSPIKFKYRNC